MKTENESESRLNEKELCGVDGKVGMLCNGILCRLGHPLYGKPSETIYEVSIKIIKYEFFMYWFVLSLINDCLSSYYSIHLLIYFPIYFLINLSYYTHVYSFFQVKFERGDVIYYDPVSYEAARALYSRMRSPSSARDSNEIKVEDESKTLIQFILITCDYFLIFMYHLWCFDIFI